MVCSTEKDATKTQKDKRELGSGAKAKELDGSMI